MADISKITTLDGTTYNLKDATARSSIPAAATANPKMDGSVSVGTSTKYARADHVHPHDTTKIDNNAKLFTTNGFAPSNLRSLYISKIDNAFYAADQRFTVNCTVNNSAISSVKTMFDGNYETGFDIPDGQSAIVTMDFSNLSGAKYPGYPYGYIFISFYSGRTPKSISGRLYNNYASQGVGWKELTVSKYDTNGYIWVTELSYYGLQTLELTITANDTSTYNQTRPVQIEFYNTRPDSSITPVVSKYREERLYYNLTAPKFIGALQGNADSATNASKVNNHTVNSDVPANAVFTDTTYESKTAASGGTDVSLVTTGEKYIWNNKGTGTITGITMNGTSKGTSGVVDLGTVITAHQDITGKLDVAQGLANAGKFLVVGSDGNITTVTMTAWQGGSY